MRRLDRKWINRGGARLVLTYQADGTGAANVNITVTLQPQGNATLVTWAMQGPVPFMAKIVHVIVNMDRIQELQPWLNGEYAVLLRTGTRLTLSRGYREKLQDRLARPV